MPSDTQENVATRFIAQQLTMHLSEFNFRQISEATGYHPETVRRFCNGESRINADFIRRVCMAYSIDANLLLTGEAVPVEYKELRHIATGKILAELSKRIERVEDFAVGHAVQTGSVSEEAVELGGS